MLTLRSHKTCCIPFGIPLSSTILCTIPVYEVNSIPHLRLLTCRASVPFFFSFNASSECQSNNHTTLQSSAGYLIFKILNLTYKFVTIPIPLFINTVLYNAPWFCATGKVSVTLKSLSKQLNERNHILITYHIKPLPSPLGLI